MNNDDFTVLVSGSSRCCWVSVCTMAVIFRMTVSTATDLHLILHEAWTFLCRNYSDESEGHSYGQLVIGSFITSCLLMHHISCRVFGEASNHPVDSAPLKPRFGALWLLSFPKTQMTFEKEEISNHRWDSGKYDGAADAIGRTVWGPKVPTLKGTEASLSCVQCFLYLLQ